MKLLTPPKQIIDRYVLDGFSFHGRVHNTGVSIFVPEVTSESELTWTKLKSPQYRQIKLGTMIDCLRFEGCTLIGVIPIESTPVDDIDGRGHVYLCAVDHFILTS